MAVLKMATSIEINEAQLKKLAKNYDLVKNLIFGRKPSIKTYSNNTHWKH